MHTSMKRPSLLVLPVLAIAALAACEDGSTLAESPGPATPPSIPTAEGGAGEGGGDAGGAAPDLDSMARGGDCAAAAGPGVEHSGDIKADETWKASDGPHRVTSNLRILATVTIEACARVLVGEGFGIQVGAAPTVGKLVARGTNTDGKLLPVLFTSLAPANRWGSLVVDASGTADLAFTVLDNGDAKGSQQNGGGVLRVFGESSTSAGGIPAITKSVRAEWLLLQGSEGPGANMLRYAGFTDDSTALAVRGAQSDAMRIELGAASALPKELVFKSNARDAVLVEQAWSGMISTTFVKRSVPYDVDGPLYLQPVEDGAAVTLTVEPGTTVRFAQGRGAAGVYVGTSSAREGQIVAKGTAALPIRFTSSKPTPAPGDWVGFYFRYYPLSGTAFEHVTIEYAGGESSATGFGCGPSDNDASMLILGKRPADAWVKSSTFRSGGGATGVVLGWVSDEAGPDFVGDNVFESMPACRVSRWRTVAAPVCPDNGGNPTCL